ncbi:MAG: histidine kinase [Arcobacter sp.]|nr:MAG: histidine kinase [Arcobacter sp.]
MSKKKLLLIDDGKTIGALINEIIEPIGYDVLWASDYEEALKWLKEEKTIDAAAVAIDLPKQMQKMVKELLSRFIPTILLSGIENKETRQKILTQEVVNYISKTDKKGLLKLVDILQSLEQNKSTKILVVDDSAVFLMYMSTLLKRHQFITVEASDGQEAIDILKKQKDISLVISDYEMPKVNGLELVQKIRKEYDSSQLPIIIVSAIGKSSTTVACLNEGANDYLHKPFEREEFISRIHLTLNNQKNIKILSEQKLLLEEYKQTLDKTTIVSMTNTEGLITYASQALLNISGYTQAELIGKAHSIFRHPDTQDNFYTVLWDTIKIGKVWKGEMKNIKKNGELFWVQTTITPEIDKEGNILGYSAVSQDNTLKKELEELTINLKDKVAEELIKNKQQANHMLQQSRLAQMGEMISMIAHQWRQPLASISAIAGTLSIDVMLDNYNKDFFQEHLEDITGLSQHLSSTINDFRGFFKETKELHKTSLQELIHSSMNIISPTLVSKGISIFEDIQENINITTYANEVQQVILNILRNSEEALMDNDVKEGKIWVQAHVKDELACICIQDNAGGISEDIINNIFDPYFSTKTKKDGTGLGLYMSKTIIEEHCKGSITVKNFEKGVWFTIFLPLDLPKGEAR